MKLLRKQSNQRPVTRKSTTNLYIIFKLLGLIPTQKLKCFYILYSFVLHLSVDVLMPLAFSLNFMLFSYQMATSDLLSSLQVAMNVSALAPKILAMKWNMKQLRASEDIMDSLDRRCQHQAEYLQIGNCVKFCNRAAALFTSMYTFCGVSIFLSSVFMGHPPYSLYMPPINWRNSKWEFWLQSLLELLLMNYACLQQSMTDGYAVQYIFIVRTHMEILVERVKRLGTEETNSQDMNYRELIKCIKDHQNILSLHAKISPIISVTIFVQFAVTAIVLGTTMINIVFFADTSARIGSVVYILGVLVQISPCCYQASCLFENSEKLPLAIQQCSWMDQDIRFRKMLIFFMQRSQRPLTLSTMKLFPVTLRTNLSIAKFFFSMYTLMKNMNFGWD